MSFNQDAARLRRELLKRPGFYPNPRCPLCGSECKPALYAEHTRQCERDCASEVILAIDKRLAQIHSTEPRGPEHATLLEVETEWLRQERYEAHNIIFGFDSQGRGTMKTDAPGWPDDGMPF
jgi:hypothetical protein